MVVNLDFYVGKFWYCNDEKVNDGQIMMTCLSFSFKKPLPFNSSIV
jgi:hypothetical protein